MKTLPLVSAAVVFVVSMGANGFAAAESRNYPAAMCSPWNDTLPSTRLSTSRIVNTSTTETMYVDCPIPQISANDSTFERITIGMIDNSANDSIKCQAVAARQVGTRIDTNALRFSASTGNSGSEINRSVRNLAKYPTGGWAYLSCSIPPKTSQSSSGMTYYRVVQ